MVMSQTSQELDEVWKELVDCVSELKDDAKGSRRMLRHVRSLENMVVEVGKAITGMSQKKQGWR